MMIKKFSQGLFLLFTLAVILNSLMYLGFTGEEGLLSSKSEVLKASWFYMMMFYLHVFLGAGALGTGVTQIMFMLAKRKTHRVLGKIYVVCVLFSGLGGTYIAIFANTGLVAQSGFFSMGVMWLTCTYFAYYYIRRGNIEQHRKWIIRSFSITLAAVTLRFWLPSFLILGMDFNIAYPIIAWLCWVPNIIVAEYFYVRKITSMQMALVEK